ncbi:GNAT family N-acetyltransferase [Paracoccus sp. (in: a-proteobacteria)]|uniref:GNAT family N-acetyltransferase n=1 Tax=Paracoccus sp. TaxID=267 RepID=UPI003A881E80
MPADLPLLGEVAHDAVHNGAGPYSQAQRAAWLPDVPDWAARLADQSVALAEQGDRIAGFMTLLYPEGYVDLAFIRPDTRGRGMFRALCTLIETRALEIGIACLHTHASLMAEGPFAACGFELVARESVERNGQSLQRAEMRKLLAEEPPA